MNKCYHNDNIISYYIAVSVILQIVDNMIPYPMFGIKLGLANIVPLFVLNIFGFIPAFQVAFFRPIVGAILTGSFGSSMFVISFLSSIFAITLMFVIKFFFEKFLSNIGLSIIGAVGHNLCQLIIVYFLFINNKDIFLLLPILIFTGTIFGFITGYLVNRILYFLPEESVLSKTNFFDNKEFLDYSYFTCNDNTTKKNVFLYYVLIFSMVIIIVITFSLINNVTIILSLFLILLLKNFFVKSGLSISSNLFKKKLRIKFYIYIFIGIIFANLFSTILYGYSKEQLISLLENIFISLLKLSTFILFTQELFKVKHIKDLLKKFPLIFKSFCFINIIIPKLEIKKDFKVISFLENILIRDVFLD